MWIILVSLEAHGLWMRQILTACNIKYCRGSVLFGAVNHCAPPLPPPPPISSDRFVLQFPSTRVRTMNPIAIETNTQHPQCVLPFICSLICRYFFGLIFPIFVVVRLTLNNSNAKTVSSEKWLFSFMLDISQHIILIIRRIFYIINSVANFIKTRFLLLLLVLLLLFAAFPSFLFFLRPFILVCVFACLRIAWQDDTFFGCVLFR